MPTSTLETKKNIQRKQAAERKSMRQVLLETEQSLTNSDDELKDKLFTTHYATNESISILTGTETRLSELGFNLLVQQTKEAVAGRLDSNGFIDEAAVLKTPQGRLLSNIIRIYCLTFGEAVARRELSHTGDAGTLVSDRILAAKFAEQLIAPIESQWGIRRSMTQEVLERELNVQMLTAWITNRIGSFCTNEFKKGKRGTVATPFKQVRLSEDTTNESDGSFTELGAAACALADIDLEGALIEEDSKRHAKTLLLRALSDLTAEQKVVMTCWLSPEGKEIYKNFKTFRNQIRAIAGLAGIKKVDALKIADEIAASLRKTFEAEIIISEKKTLVFADRATAMRAREGMFNRSGRAKTKHVLKRDDEVESRLLTERFVSGTRCCPFVVSSDVDELFKLFFNRDIPVAQMLNALR